MLLFFSLVFALALCVAPGATTTLPLWRTYSCVSPGCTSCSWTRPGWPTTTRVSSLSLPAWRSSAGEVYIILWITIYTALVIQIRIPFCMRIRIRDPKTFHTDSDPRRANTIEEKINTNKFSTKSFKMTFKNHKKLINYCKYNFKYYKRIFASNSSSSVFT